MVGDIMSRRKLLHSFGAVTAMEQFPLSLSGDCEIANSIRPEDFRAPNTV